MANIAENPIDSVEAIAKGVASDCKADGASCAGGLVTDIASYVIPGVGGAKIAAKVGQVANAAKATKVGQVATKLVGQGTKAAQGAVKMVTDAGKSVASNAGDALKGLKESAADSAGLRQLIAALIAITVAACVIGADWP